MVKINYSTVVAISIVIVVAVAIGFAVSGNTFNKPAGPEKSGMTLTDMEGRTVTLNSPVERIVLMESSKTAELAAIAGDGFAEKIVGWDNDIKQNAGDEYAMFVARYPQLAEIPDVGSLDDGTFSIEKVISLKPDVVIMHNWQFMWAGDATRDALAKLELAGIPVVFVDFYMDPMVNSTKSMLLLGKILDREERATEIVDFYNNHVDAVYSRLATMNGTKPSVYVEQGYRGPSEYDITEGDAGWGSIVKKAGGDNIAEPLLGKSGKPLNPEYLISKSPDIIILTGRNWSTPGSIRMGYTSTPEDTRRTMDGYLARPGWDSINAVKNQKIYAIHQGYTFSVYNFIMLEAFAKWFYPEEFKDVDPDATIKEYHDRFMPIDYSGTFVCSYY